MIIETVSGEVRSTECFLADEQDDEEGKGVQISVTKVSLIHSRKSLIEYVRRPSLAGLLKISCTCARFKD